MLKILGTCDRLHAPGQSQSDNWELGIQENSNTLLHDPTNRRILRGPSSSAISSFKYLGKDLVDTFGFVVVSFFWFDQ